jgi:hypothetical protein
MPDPDPVRIGPALTSADDPQRRPFTRHQEALTTRHGCANLFALVGASARTEKAVDDGATVVGRAGVFEIAVPVSDERL